MAGRRRAALWLLAAAALALVAAPAGAADPAREALAARDAYVSPRALGPAAPAAEAELAATAAELRRERRPVKLAIAVGPVGAPSMRVYAIRLAQTLGLEEETLVVTAPGRPVTAVGPLPPAQITRTLRAAGVGRVANPVDRVVRAAELVAPPAPEDEGGTREVVILLALAGLGGVWAIAWGARRQARGEHERMLEARAAMRVRLDALRGHATALARRDGLPPGARAPLEHALGAYAQAVAGLQQARSHADVDALEPLVRDGLRELARARERAGDAPGGEDPFAGLCGVDPGHGPATAEADLADGHGATPVCAACREAADRGEPLRRRMIPSSGRPVPFTEAAAPAPPPEQSASAGRS
jgi:hypothetical protein